MTREPGDHGPSGQNAVQSAPKQKEYKRERVVATEEIVMELASRLRNAP